MKSFRALVAKELLEILRTWRIWVLPGLLLFLALSGPVTARFVKEIMDSVLPGSGAQIADPTWRDTLVQWNKNLAQIGTVAVLLVSGGLINAEARQGTQVLILTKPISRNAYVLAKLLSQTLLIVGAIVLATLVEHGVSLVLFPQSQLLDLVAVSALWVLQVLFLLTVVLLGSACFDSAIAASGLGFAAMLLQLLVGRWGPVAEHSPAGVGGLIGKLVAGESLGGGLFWPVSTTLLGAVVWVFMACWVFGRKEL